jgi:hypothetical protein
MPSTRHNAAEPDHPKPLSTTADGGRQEKASPRSFDSKDRFCRVVVWFLLVVAFPFEFHQDWIWTARRADHAKVKSPHRSPEQDTSIQTPDIKHHSSTDFQSE